MSSLKLQWVNADTGAQVTESIPEGVRVRVGRSPANGWKVTGDKSISREHVDLWIADGEVCLQCLESARQPIVFCGDEFRDISLPAGGSFTIGATVFAIVCDELPQLTIEGAESPVEEAQDPSTETTIVEEQAYSHSELKKVRFSAAEQQIEILASLPEITATTRNDDELAVTVAGLLLDGIPQAVAVAVVYYDESQLNWDPSAGEAPSPTLMKVKTREGFNGRFLPSRRLMLKAITSQESMLHIWQESSSTEYTMTPELGWAFACPVRGEGCRGWCLYVSGTGSRKSLNVFTKEDVSGDLRFTELLTDFIGSIRQVRFLQNQRTQLSAFFSPRVIENLIGGQEQSSLQPSERDVTVLFCDLRGFSKRSESLQHDLLALLQSVSEALGVMTDGVLGLDGAIADFQGDAVLAFWGWPLPHKDGPLPACRSALQIEAEFRRTSADAGSRLAGLACGIGVAHGRALAGKIGTDKQAKIGVFGPVVNQGSRLEGMTKQFGVTICIDEATATHVRANLSPEVARARRLARVRPKGMETAMNIFTLYPPEPVFPSVTGPMIEIHEQALQALTDGRWQEAQQLLKQLPETDGPARFLRAFLSKGAPPSPWDGVIQLESK